jgi:hypothetical protein
VLILPEKTLFWSLLQRTWQVPAAQVIQPEERSRQQDEYQDWDFRLVFQLHGQIELLLLGRVCEIWH